MKPHVIMDNYFCSDRINKLHVYNVLNTEYLIYSTTIFVVMTLPFAENVATLNFLDKISTNSFFPPKECPITEIPVDKVMKRLIPVPVIEKSPDRLLNCQL